MSQASAADIWNQRYGTNEDRQRVYHEAWLERFQDSLLRLPGRKALDVGCGAGFDTEWLTLQGFQVTALDPSEAAIRVARERNPGSRFWVADALAIGTEIVGSFDLIIASLSLHYMNRPATELAFQLIYQNLLPGGLFAFRLNAFDEYGAPPDPLSWELVTVEGIPKQFFTEDKIRGLLGDAYQIEAIEKLTTFRYGKSKSLFEVIARRNSSPSSSPNDRAQP